MATTEEKVEKLETRFSTLEQQFVTTMAKVDSLLEEAKQQREDIRRVQEKHDADMRETREDIKRAQEKHDADMKAMQTKQDADRKALEDKIDRLGDKIQNMVIAAVVGFGAIVFAAVSTLK